ncbi:MAG: hypothetical protein HDQ88_08235 [Clostridia bacterium]|nr:hypothetical protein [Clostridia bacterium]
MKNNHRRFECSAAKKDPDIQHCSLSAYFCVDHENRLCVWFDGLYSGRGTFFFQWTAKEPVEIDKLERDVTSIMDGFTKESDRLTPEVKADLQAVWDDVRTQIGKTLPKAREYYNKHNRGKEKHETA